MKKLVSLVLILILALALVPAHAEETSLYDLLKTAPEFDATCERVFSVRPRNTVTPIAQGGCSDGTYHYQAFIFKDKSTNEEKNVAVIVKTDMATGEFVAVSDYLRLNHCNDLTFNSKTNQIIACHNNPNRTRISLIDPETLTLIETKELPCKIYCIEYNAQRDQYVIGISGGQTFRFLNSDFTYADDTIHHPNAKSLSCTTQGVGASDDLIAFVLWKPNMISVFDWEGNEVCVIHLTDMTMFEPENITFVNDEIYITCLVSSSAAVYKVSITGPSAK